MLKDSHMTTANQLLKQQFPSIRGLQSTLLGQDISFQPMDTPCTQILHVGGLHWVTVEACHDSLVKVFYPTLSESVQTQTASIMQSQRSSITFVAETTQFQRGGADCGLFAIAYATDLCYGNNPAAYRYVFCY